MHKIVSRITVIRMHGDQLEPVVIYKKPGAGDNKTSPLLRPLERAVRHVCKAGELAGQDAHSRHLKSSKRRNGWLMDAPSNLLKAGRKAYNEARKGVPFKILPKAD